MEEPGQLKRALIDATAGAISGAISRTVTSPLDVIKIRFQVQLEPTVQWALLHKNIHSPSKYTGMVQAAKNIFREEGLQGFWRGNIPALLMLMDNASAETDASQTIINLEVQHRYLTWRAGKDPGHQHLRSLTGETLTKEIIRSFLFKGVDELGRKTFIDYFPEYKCDDGTVNQKCSMLGKLFESRPWDIRGEFIGNTLK